MIDVLGVTDDARHGVGQDAQNKARMQVFLESRV